MKKTVRVKLSSLVFDPAIFPRGTVDRLRVYRLGQVIQAGGRLPPLLVDKATNAVVDGWHRAECYRETLGTDCEVEVDYREFADKEAMLLEAARVNDRGPKALSTSDHAVVISKGAALGIGIAAIAGALSMTVEQVEHIRATRIAAIQPAGEEAEPAFILKRGLSHLAGQTLTDQQRKAAGKVGGEPPSKLVRDLLVWLRGNILDWEDKRLVAALEDLRQTLESVLPARADLVPA